MTHLTILLTSFQTWLPRQKSNSSDDLLECFKNINLPEKELIFLRNLPVNTEIASTLTIEKIKEVNPHFVICCGMAEKSKYLHIESQAFFEDKYYQTKVNLTDLIQDLNITEISYDAGKFVCEGLYFQVLQYIENQTNIQGLFIHVPILTTDNINLIREDFEKILNRIR